MLAGAAAVGALAVDNRSGEALGSRLAALHNLTYYMNLLGRAREAIFEGRFEAFRAEIEAVSERRL